jgi:hypothetical protein
MRLLRPIEIAAKEIPWIASRPIAGFFNRAAAEFYSDIAAHGYEAEELLKVLPRHNLIYVAVPKSASTRIRRTLAQAGGRHSRSLKPDARPRYRGPYGPRNMTVGAFHHLATNPKTLRFSFVRNPYARAVSCWSDKFANKPLIPGDAFIDIYLATRQDIDPDLPAGAHWTLSFADFVTFAAATARTRRDVHLQVQDDILNIPGLPLDFIGKVETFDADFVRVLDHLNASEALRREAAVPLNESRHDDWPNYYSGELADRIYRAYERDFDRFGYRRALSDGVAVVSRAGSG